MFKVIGIVCAALIVASIFGGYFLLRSRQAAAQQVDERAGDTQPATRERAKVHVLEDEAFLRRSDAVIGGTIRNVSDQKLSNLLLTIKLQSRDGRTEELRTIATSPEDLEPQASANYSVAVSSAKWSGAKVVAVVADGDSNPQPFLSMRGKPRPREAPPAPIVRTITVERPKPTNRKGEEFLNTPDTAVPIR